MSEVETTGAAIRYASAMVGMAWKPNGSTEALEMTLMQGSGENGTPRITAPQFTAAMEFVIERAGGQSTDVTVSQPDATNRPRRLNVTVNAAALRQARAWLAAKAA